MERDLLELLPPLLRRLKDLVKSPHAVAKVHKVLLRVQEALDDLVLASAPPHAPDAPLAGSSAPVRISERAV